MKKGDIVKWSQWAPELTKAYLQHMTTQNYEVVRVQTMKSYGEELDHLVVTGIDDGIEYTFLIEHFEVV